MAAAPSSKQQLEAFRARQYAGPHPALAVAAQQAPLPPAHGAAGEEPLPPPDTGRVVLHFDIDCFYAQVEEVRGARGCRLGLALTVHQG